MTAAPTHPKLRPQARPLSPFMLGQLYRWQISSVLSIFHRATGIALCAGLCVITWWLIAAASGPDYYEYFQNFAGSLIGQIMLIGWAWALYYHTLAGLRHLAWDMGYGYEIVTMSRSGWIVIGGSALLTLLTWMAV